jgi:hypothetical protein
MHFLDALGYTCASQLNLIILSVVLLWLCVNTLLLNRWIMRQQCYAAQALAARLMRLHLGTSSAAVTAKTPCQTLLIAGDPSYRHMLVSVLDAKTFTEQVFYTQQIDRLLRHNPPSINRYTTRDVIFRDAPELLESLQLRRWKGQFPLGDSQTLFSASDRPLNQQACSQIPPTTSTSCCSSSRSASTFWPCAAKRRSRRLHPTGCKFAQPPQSAYPITAPASANTHMISTTACTVRNGGAH